MINRGDARSTEESAVATENAISAVVKIIRNCCPGMDVSNVSEWIGMTGMMERETLFLVSVVLCPLAARH